MGELGKRVALAIALPLTGLLLLAAVVAYQWQRQLESGEAGRAAATLALRVSELVSALQQERGAAAASLSGSAQFAAMLPARYADTDAGIAAFQRYRDANAAGAEPGLQAELSSARTALARLPELRRRTAGGAGPPLATMDAYNTIITALMRTLIAAALASGSPALAQQVLAYDRLMAFKEYAARERGLGAALLGGLGRDRSLHRAYLDSLASQQAMLRQFREAPADSPDRQVLEVVDGVPAGSQLTALRDRLVEPARLDGGDPQAALLWFRLAGERIDGLAEGLERLAARMSATAHNLGVQARWRFAALAGGLALVVLAVVWQSVRIGRRLAWQVQAEQRDAERIRFLGRHDQLTGLPNRDYFQEILETHRRHTLQHDQMLALHLLDVVAFKEINRIWGLAVGDAVILEVARRLRPFSGGDECLARFYGDQFGLIQAPVGGRGEAEERAQAILGAFEAPVEVEARQFPLKVRIGITLFPPDARSYELLLRNADLARQHVDKGERAGYRFYVSEMYREYLGARSLVRELRHADIEREFVLLYQPKLAADDQRLLGAEALIRWNHPTRGLLEPSTFIHAAEDSGDIIKIGRWVVREACRQQGEWQRAGLVPPVLAFNLSAVELHQLGLVKALREAIDAAHLDPRSLEVEVTETAVITDLEATLGVLRQIRALGVGLAIDDFGTGYSSLTYLHRFPATALKLDRSFILSLETSNESQRIVDAVISIAHGLSMRVVAEGVETQPQLALLRQKGCDELQGMLLAPPLTAAELAERLPRAAGTSRG